MPGRCAGCGPRGSPRRRTASALRGHFPCSECLPASRGARRCLWTLEYVSFLNSKQNHLVCVPISCSLVPLQEHAWDAAGVSRPSRAGGSRRRVWGGRAALAQPQLRRWPGKQLVLQCVFSDTHFMEGPSAATDSSLSFSIALRGDESNDIE